MVDYVEINGLGVRGEVQRVPEKKVNQQSLIEPRYVAGVGNGSQQANYEVELTAGMVDTEGLYHEGIFRA
eukprot:4400628-Pyramimonas_sp.AAC.1